MAEKLSAGRANLLFLLYRYLAVVILLVLLLYIGFLVYFGAFNIYIEKITGRTPQTKVYEYLQAVENDDKERALRVWDVARKIPGLDARSKYVTQNLITLKIKDFAILDIEWWGTCCMPHVTSDPRGAGGARILVRLEFDKDNVKNYVFDVFVPGGYEGVFEKYPLRTWVLKDVFPLGVAPLYWCSVSPILKEYEKRNK